MAYVLRDLQRPTPPAFARAVREHALSAALRALLAEGISAEGESEGDEGAIDAAVFADRYRMLGWHKGPFGAREVQAAVRRFWIAKGAEDGLRRLDGHPASLSPGGRREKSLSTSMSSCRMASSRAP